MQALENKICIVDVRTEANQSAGSKRRRAPNFTDKEVRLLIKLVFAHIEIIESKKTDSETWRVKDLVWNNITENFNNCSGTTKRTVEMIRQKYDSLKKVARKKDAKNKEDAKGEHVLVDLEDYEKELIRLLEHNISQSYEPVTVILPDTKFADANIKTESCPNSQPLNSVEAEVSDSREEETFIITDDDVLWDLPNDTANRPRLQLVKKQLEHIEQEEQRQIVEHQYRMRTQEIKRKVCLNKERRARAEHKKKMELLELELELKKRTLDQNSELDADKNEKYKGGHGPLNNNRRQRVEERRQYRIIRSTIRITH